MSKIIRYDKTLSILSWWFLALITISMAFLLITNNINNVLIKNSTSVTLLIVSFTIYNTIKSKIVYNQKKYSGKVFEIFRYVEVILLSVFLIPFNDGIEYSLLAIPLVFYCLYSGKKKCLILLALSVVIKIVNNIIMYFLLKQAITFLVFFNACFIFVWIYTILIAVIFVADSFKVEIDLNEKENKRLVAELGEKYEQLEAAQIEIKNQYDKMMDTNHVLEDTNSKLTASIAEFYTLQQISEAIGSIMDIGELLKFVNDVIIGVMGVNFSTIVLLDKRKNRLKVKFTNIQHKEHLAILSDNINCDYLVNIMKNETFVLDNEVNPENYDFIGIRQVGSFICLPLSSKVSRFGLILIEHKNQNTFNDENLRLAKTVCKTVSMAIENAELYASMQELATIDGLTGVYNRVYFHQNFEKEFEMAKSGGYDISLAILDIDFFKKFNDTYGHLFGDVVLKSVAQTVKNNLRVTDTVARFGGEEFVVVLPHTNSREAYEKVESLRKKIVSNVVKDNLISASVTASFGIASYPETSANQNELIKDADNALYKAKASGRNCTKVAKDIEYTIE